LIEFFGLAKGSAKKLLQIYSQHLEKRPEKFFYRAFYNSQFKNMTEEIKKLISEAKNICIIPSEENEGESVLNALALFYTLKELTKNVNLIIDNLPEKFSFLVPSLDFISSPKNFVISIPRSEANVSQVYYEKTEENLKIHLTLDSGKIGKENISFYYSEPKPDLIITLGIKDFQEQLSDKLNSFGFLLGSPILNIDTEEVFGFAPGENKRFGKLNLIKNNSISEIVLEVIKSLDENLVKGNTASSILAGITLYYENFQNTKTTPEAFELCAYLMKKGADRKQITENLYKQKNAETLFTLHNIKA